MCPRVPSVGCLRGCVRAWSPARGDAAVGIPVGEGRGASSTGPSLCTERGSGALAEARSAVGGGPLRAPGPACPSAGHAPLLFSALPHPAPLPTGCGTSISFLAPDVPDFHPKERPLGTVPHVCGPLLLHQRPRHCDDRDHPLRLRQPR